MGKSTNKPNNYQQAMILGAVSEGALKQHETFNIADVILINCSLVINIMAHFRF